MESVGRRRRRCDEEHVLCHIWPTFTAGNCIRGNGNGHMAHTQKHTKAFTLTLYKQMKIERIHLTFLRARCECACVCSVVYVCAWAKMYVYKRIEIYNFRIDCKLVVCCLCNFIFFYLYLLYQFICISIFVCLKPIH